MGSNEHQEDTPKFNPVAASRQVANSSEKLHEMLKAKQAAKNSASTRDFAVKTIRGLEPLIQQLLDADATINEILTQLVSTLPSIPAEDLRYALNILRSRKKLRMAASESTPIPQSAAAAQAAKKPEKKTSLPTAKTPASSDASLPSDLPVWADGSDRMADESDDDYRLRKEIEGPPEARQKFIGEH